jgi:DNA polymerase-3 subunit epsilon
MPRAETIRIHGLRAVDLETAAPLEESLDLMLEALAGRFLVANVAWVERRFLSAALGARGIELRGPVLDSDVLSQAVPDRVKDPEEESLRVGGTSGPRQSREARRLGLPVHRPHHADGDALTAAQIFIATVAHLDRAEPQTVGSLVELSERAAG